MSWQGYRNSKLGNSLVEALDKFITEGKLEPEQADIILQQYDKSTAKFLGKSNVKATLKGDLHTYRYAEDREPNAFIFFFPSLSISFLFLLLLPNFSLSLQKRYREGK